MMWLKQDFVVGISALGIRFRGENHNALWDRITLRILWIYRNDPKFSDRYALANSADPDQTAPLGAI